MEYPLYFRSNEQVWPLNIDEQTEIEPQGRLVAIAGGFDVPLLISSILNPKEIVFVDSRKRQLEFAKTKWDLSKNFPDYDKVFFSRDEISQEELAKKFPTEDPEELRGLRTRLFDFYGEDDSFSLRRNYQTAFNYYGKSPSPVGRNFYSKLRNWGRHQLNANLRQVSFREADIFDLESEIKNNGSSVSVYFSNIADYLSREQLLNLFKLVRDCNPNSVFYDATGKERTKHPKSPERFTRDSYLERINSWIQKTSD
jgi:hypothetical protein